MSHPNKYRHFCLAPHQLHPQVQIRRLACTLCFYTSKKTNLSHCSAAPAEHIFKIISLFLRFQREISTYKALFSYDLFFSLFIYIVAIISCILQYFWRYASCSKEPIFSCFLTRDDHLAISSDNFRFCSTVKPCWPFPNGTPGRRWLPWGGSASHQASRNWRWLSSMQPITVLQIP